MTASSGTGARFERRDADWLSVREALSRTLDAARPLPAETVTLVEAQGRALAEAVRAEATLPPWNNSAMDGYAVRAEDVTGSADAPVSLPVSGVVRAGGDAGKVLAPGHAIRIMTGAPIPEGADTVIRVEDTDREAGRQGVVVILSDRDAGRHVRAAGQDMREGTTLFEPGRTVTPGVVGVLVAAGRAEVEVHRRPRAAILTTGDELRTVDRYEDVRVGLGVPESNGPMLAAMARSVGAEPRALGIAPDDAGELRERILTGRDADVLVTVGGASMGEADLVKRVLDGLGFELDFWRVRMRPGSPISFGWLVHDGRRQAVFGLPGNPSSAFVTFELFVRPFLLRLAGHRRVRRRVVPCVASERFDTPAELTYFQRVSLQAREGVLTASLTGPQLSGLVTGLASADGLAVVAPERRSVEAGEHVDVLLLDPGPAAMPDDAFPGGPLG